MHYRVLDMEDPKLKGWGMREGGREPEDILSQPM